VSEKDVRQIRVGKFVVSIMGMKQVMEEMAETHAGASDDEVGSLMLDRLEKSNYIPNSSKEEYGKAFVREFRKFLGRPYVEDAPREIDIKVLGTGCCNQCHDLMQVVMEVLTEINLPAGIDQVTDLKEIARYGIMGVPALLINGKAVAVGRVPPRDKVKKWLLEASAF
jgi:hypothetical protein